MRTPFLRLRWFAPSRPFLLAPILLMTLAASFYPQVPPAVAATSYSITELGTLGGNESVAEEINDSGQVVGSSGIDPANGVSHGFLWSASSGMLDLGTLGGYYSIGRGVNDSGQAAGFSDIDPANGITDAFLWSANSGLQGIGTLGGTGSRAFGINNTGQIVGWADTASGYSHAFLWSASSGMQDLGTLGRNYSAAFGINNTGQVVGQSSIEGSPYGHAFLWSASSGMQNIETLGGIASIAWDINNAGKVVGSACTASSCTEGDNEHAFLWSANSGMQDLGTLGGNYSEAFGINDFGQIVGDWRDVAGATPHAFLWSAGVMTDLNTILPPNSGWELQVANDINTNGQIVGYGLHNGQTRAFLMAPAQLGTGLLAPFNNGVTFEVKQPYKGQGGYYNNRSQNNTGCPIGVAPDHCQNQLFGLDLVPDQQSDKTILAPVAGKVDFLPSDPKSGGCIGLTLDDGIHINVCHFDTWTVKRGQKVVRGKVLGTRSTLHVHISLDDRRHGKPYIPIPFTGTHILEGTSLDPNPNGETVAYAKRTFRVDFGQYTGWRGVSSNVAIP